MKRKTIYSLLALALVCLSSCLRDEIEPCPPLKVMIGIKDKNYANIDEIERTTGLDCRIDERQPFRSYIEKLLYVLYNAETGEEVLVRHLHDVQGDASLATASFPEELPFGKYVLVVWGNMLSEDPLLHDKDYRTYRLHSGGAEGYDAYMTSDTLLYDDSHYNYTVELERVKGKLLVQVTNLPYGINRARTEVSGVSDYVDHAFNYSGNEVSVITSNNFGMEEPTVLMGTYLAHSVKKDKSKMEISFFDQSGIITPRITSRRVNVDIRRNEITVLKYEYDEGKEDFNIYVLLNDAWSVVNDMDIE